MADIAWGLLRHGYDALGRERAAHGGADDFSGRLLGRRAVVVRSLRGTQSFYDEAITRRKGAIPPPLAWLLFGRGAVHALDEESHAARKSLLRELLAPERLGPMVD